MSSPKASRKAYELIQGHWRCRLSRRTKTRLARQSIQCRACAKGRKRKRCTVSVASIARGAVRTSARGMGRQIGTPLTRAMRSLFLKHEVRAQLENGYPAFVWENGMHVFFHEFNWLRAHNLWAKPWRRETMHIHHVNGDKLDCQPKNLVLLTGREHDALHSHERR